MGKIKVVVTALLFAGSCVALATTHGVLTGLLEGYGAAIHQAVDTRASLFTLKALSIVQNSAAICFGSLVASAALAAMAIWRSASREAKLYWVTVLSSANYYISGFLLSTTLVGFFLLPKVANGT